MKCVFILLVLQMFSCIGFVKRQTLPQSPLGDVSQFTIASFPHTRLNEFQILTNHKIPIRYSEGGKHYVSFTKQDWDLSYKNYDLFTKEPSDLGFKYISGNEETRIEKKHFELSDILQGYKDNTLNQRYLKKTNESFPHFTQLYVLGETKGKQKLFAFRMTDLSVEPSSKIPVLFHCSLHANETITTEHCYDIIYQILSSKESTAKYLSKLDIWILPIANPDGAEAFWNQSHLLGRKNNREDNGNGVDLNRNFPFHWGKSGSKFSSQYKTSPYYRGKEEASEEETKMLIRLADSHRFVASIGFHAYANSLLIPYSIESYTNPNPDLAKLMADKIVKNVTSYHPEKEFTAKKNLYPVDGVDQDFLYFRYGTLAYVLESSHLNPDYAQVPGIISGFRPIWQNLLNELIDSKKIWIQIQDEEKNPVSVEVRLENLQLFHGENRTSHPNTGVFFLLWDDSLKGKIFLEKDGYESLQLDAESCLGNVPKIIIMKRKK
ncbi:M14 family zinc carboxypeptidase [Leptospira idonii]|uniref:M14 family zinc carboxypeptidase n=1 Tax=Leptospira idonii TaxID=1193500 RepID=UPI0014386C5F|nr:M14 family zinc carboxypeptidase [Leptospira idonii]